jgi:hypothetical protein
VPCPRAVGAVAGAYWFLDLSELRNDSFCFSSSSWNSAGRTFSGRSRLIISGVSSSMERLQAVTIGSRAP